MPYENQDIETHISSSQTDYELSNLIFSHRITWITDEEVNPQKNELNCSFINNLYHIVLR